MTMILPRGEERTKRLFKAFLMQSLPLMAFLNAASGAALPAGMTHIGKSISKDKALTFLGKCKSHIHRVFSTSSNSTRLLLSLPR